jgi:hypothetical protein
MQWWTSVACAATLLALGWTSGARADVNIPAGASWELGAAHLQLGGGNLVVGGRLALGSGLGEGIAAVDILAGGRIEAASGTLRLFGPWRNQGNFDAGFSLVEFIDGALTSADVSGSTRFHDAAWNSSSGKTWRFAVGSTQTFAGQLDIHGLPGTPIRISSDALGQPAYYDLLPGGAQSISDVSVTDVHAIGQHLAPTQQNQGGSNALGWFGGSANGVVQVPAASNSLLLLMAALLLLVAFRSRRA